MNNHTQKSALIQQALHGGGRLVVVTGAGIAAESGIPTFRGAGGYWTAGSRVFRPQELATWSAFQADPWKVWQWYLYRRGVCRRAQPNAGHAALHRMRVQMGHRYALVTQNVDGLHRRAADHTVGGDFWEIHGNLDFMRCLRCNLQPQCMPDSWVVLDKSEPLSDIQKGLLRCRRCAGPTRPHILWFDEEYDDVFFPLHTVLQKVKQAAIVLFVGTSGSTSLPWEVANAAAAAGALLLDVNIEQNELHQKYPQSIWLRGAAGSVLPQIAQFFR